MEQQEFEIEIKKNGEVKVHIKGIKGAKCMKYTEFFQNMIGPVKEEEFTAEYYEPEVHNGINVSN